MPISEYIMNTINDIIARYVELHMEAYLKYQRAAAEHQRTFGGKYKKGEKPRDTMTENERAAANWLDNHSWPPAEAFKDKFFEKLWKNAKGRSGYAAHWRKLFMHSYIERTASAASAAAEGHFEKCGDLEYTRMSERVNPNELTLEDALREEDTDVNSPDLLDEFCKTKAPNMARRQELCGELQSRSLRISRLLELLQQHAVDAKEAKKCYKNVLKQKKDQLKERADALASTNEENEELKLENNLLRERIGALESMVDERDRALGFLDFSLSKYDRMYTATVAENQAFRNLVERNRLLSPLRVPTPPPPPPPRRSPTPVTDGRMPNQAWRNLPPPESPDNLSVRADSPTDSFLERSAAEIR